jgi:hypothetical protein
MGKASGPRRGAASAGIAVALAAGAASGIVAADLERTVEVGSATVSVAEPATPATDQASETDQTPAPEAETLPSLTPAPAAPQNPRAGQVPHTSTRAS